MRIGIDGYNLAMPQGTGIATYGYVLAHTLRAAGHRVEGVFGIDVGANPDTREVLFYDRVNREPNRQKSRGEAKRDSRRIYRAGLWPLPTKVREIPLSDKIEKTTFADRLPAFDRLVSTPDLFQAAERHFKSYKRCLKLQIPNPPEVMHWTYPVPVKVIGSRNIYTLHDLVPLRLPFTSLDVKPNYAALLQECIREAACLCTVSEASRSDIIDQFGVDPAQVVNTYQTAVLPAEILESTPEADAGMIEGVFGLSHRSYFVFFGNIEPKKNLGRLLEAYLSTQTQTPLVIVGSRGWQAEEELRLLPKGDAAQSNFGKLVAQRIIRLEHLPRALLLRLIRSARAVAFPSLYEGFGLPVLEAMQLGTPVLTSNVSSLPEIAGEAAIFVDPYDVRSIAAGLVRLDGDEALRTSLGRAGIEQAKKFSVDRYRERLDVLYRTALRH